MIALTTMRNSLLLIVGHAPAISVRVALERDRPARMKAPVVLSACEDCGLGTITAGGMVHGRVSGQRRPKNGRPKPPALVGKSIAVRRSSWATPPLGFRCAFSLSRPRSPCRNLRRSAPRYRAGTRQPKIVATLQRPRRKWMLSCDYRYLLSCVRVSLCDTLKERLTAVRDQTKSSHCVNCQAARRGYLQETGGRAPFSTKPGFSVTAEGISRTQR